MRLSLNIKTSAFVAGAFAGLAVALSGHSALGVPPNHDQPARPTVVHRIVAAMGTTFSLRVEAVDRAQALRAGEAAIRAVEETERRLSTWRDTSELARLNRWPPGLPFEASPALLVELRRARRWWHETSGAFDPGSGALVRAWGLREGGRRPDDAELRAALAPHGLASLEIGREVVRRHPELLLEEGGFGKGAGLDAALQALAADGATGAVLDLGGQVAVAGTGAPATIAVADPDDRARALATLVVRAGSVATSGNGERGIEVGGRRLGHVLDPRTGLPADDFGSITVWATDATAADCLSTALYVMGPDAALAWARPRHDVEVLVVERGEPLPRIRVTPGLRGLVEPLVAGLSIHFVGRDVAGPARATPPGAGTGPPRGRFGAPPGPRARSES